MLLQNKSALITGGSQGIGKAIAEQFVRHGVENLVLVARDLEKLRELKSDLENEAKTRVEILELDVRDGEQVRAIAKEIKAKSIPIDIIVNNAGIFSEGVLRMIKKESLHEVYATNVFGTLYVTQSFMSGMLKRRSGAIINLSSIIGTNGAKGQTVYGSSKSAIIGFTKALSKELAPLQIRVNAIAPGFIETDMTRNMGEDTFDNIVQAIGMGRIGSPEDVARVAVFLASDLSEYVTGQVIGVDGGMIL